MRTSAATARARDPRRAHVTGAPGEFVSLLPVHGPAEGVTTEGLEYPLHGETLAPGTTRGLEHVRRCSSRVARRAAAACSRPPRPRAEEPVTPWRRLGAFALAARAARGRGCGDSGDEAHASEVVLVTHDSFAIPKQVKAAFERESGSS